MVFRRFAKPGILSREGAAPGYVGSHHLAETDGRDHVQKRLVTRYEMRSEADADENQRRIEGVFAALAESKPDNVSYIVLRLADDSFVHISFHDHTEDEVNPIASTSAFNYFQDGHDERRRGSVDQQTARLVGAYVTRIG